MTSFFFIQTLALILASTFDRRIAGGFMDSAHSSTKEQKSNLAEAPSGIQVLQQINHPHKKKMVAFSYEGRLFDLRDPLPSSEVQWISSEEDLGQEIIRHSTAHLLAAALQKEFPGTHFAVGPVKGETFFYDFRLPQGKRIKEGDLSSLERVMRQIIKKQTPFTRKEVSRKEALELFQNQPYKLELIEKIPPKESIFLYFLGDWFDLCEGPHVPQVHFLGHFQLLSVSGAYWQKGNTQEQLDRITGTAWSQEKELKIYLHKREEAKKRDHIRLGQEMGLFEIHSQLSPGCPFFYPRGFFLKKILMDYARSLLQDPPYWEVETPQIYKTSLWETSGHTQHFQEDMFFLKHGPIESADEALKPMSCPGHIRMFQNQSKSYRDLPFRLFEFGVVHRNELSGALHGLTRVRRITQDDAHIFCQPDQVFQEIKFLLKKIEKIRKDFQFQKVNYHLSTRPDSFLGAPEEWDQAEGALEEALKDLELPYSIKEKDGSFYGPKIDFYFQDSLERWHQCSTIQLDFNLPKRFGITYRDQANQDQTPILIHRALFGSVERFMGLYLENCGGHLHPALHPEPLRVLTLSEKQMAFGEEMASKFKAANIRVGFDGSSDSLGAKIKKAHQQRIPFLVILGEKEEAENRLSVRFQNQTQSFDFESFLSFLKNQFKPFQNLSEQHRHSFQPAWLKQ